MAQKIRRSAPTARRQARRQGTKRQVRQARATTGWLVDGALGVLPFSQDQVQRFFLILILAGVAALAWGVASLAGLTVLLGQQFSTAAANAGFEVRKVEVRGVERMNELTVYERVLGERDRAMPQVDLHALRDSLLQLNWVKDARVSRQLPDRIVVDIVEREPHAALRKGDRLVLIDGDGHELEPVSTAAAKGMLVISGAGAQEQVRELSALLDAAPALRPKVEGAEWIGHRRWNLTFDTGQVLSLPQGEERAAGALMDFARVDGMNRLIGGKAVAFDMRVQNRFYVRCPACREEERAAMADRGS